MAALRVGAEQAEGASHEGAPVAAVRFLPEVQAVPFSELEELAGIRPGDGYSAAAVRRAIAALYRTNRFADIAVSADRTGNGLVLTFQLEPNWFIGRVSVEGVSGPPSEGQLQAVTKLGLGEELRDGSLLQATENLAGLLRLNGLHDARLRPEVTRNPETGAAAIRFVVEPGKRARFTAPRLAGNVARPTEALIRASGWQRLGRVFGWRTATDARVQAGLDRMRRAYQNRGYLTARVSLDGMAYADQRVTPSISITEGSRYTVRSQGLKLSQRRLRELIPVFEERSVDRDLLLEGQRNLLSYLGERGHFDADVGFTNEPGDPGEQVITYEVAPGPEYTLASVAITGNRYFDLATLHERMEVTPASFPRFRKGIFSRQLLERDERAIAALYRSNGFLKVDVQSQTEVVKKGRSLRQTVAMRIDEGPQTRVGAFELLGASPENRETILALLRLSEGQPYSEDAVASDRDAILNSYFNNGYPDARFDWEAKAMAEDRVALTYTVTEGRRLLVRAVLVEGLVRTDPELVRRRILLKPGDPLSQSKLLESQRRLYDLGIFARVEAAIQNPDGVEDSKYVVLQVEEARKWSLNSGVGAEITQIGGSFQSFDAPAGGAGFSPRVLLGVSRSNFLGQGHTVGAQTRVSTIQQLSTLTYQAPQFRDRQNLNLTFTALFDNSRSVRTFNSRRLETSAQLGQRVSRASTLLYRYSIRRVSIEAQTLKIQPQLIPRLAQPVRIGVASATFIQDHRDNPLESTKGFYNTVDFALAAAPFASNSDFVRLLGRNSTYHRLGRDMVLARTTSMGYLRGFDTRGLIERDVPLPERFFAGGANTHRGFPENQAGPRDLLTGFPLGGKAMFVNGTELRFPMVGHSVGGVLFHDAGNVYQELSKLTLRARQRDVRDFDYMVHTVGFGIRYRTPVGPVRLDVGFSPNSARFFGFKGTREQLLFGQGVQTVQRINRFQFHFSLGQTF